MPDLERVRAGLAAEYPPPEPPPDLPPESPADAPLIGTLGDGGAGDPDAIESLVEDPTQLPLLSAEDWSDLIETGFGWVADAKGPHWEIQEKRARRLGKLMKKSFDGVGGTVPPWAEKLVIPLVTLAVLSLEVGRRMRIDTQIEARKAAAAADLEPR